MASREQVEAKAAQIFGRERLADVMAILDTCGVPEGEGAAREAERQRVRLAILRLCEQNEAGEDLAGLRQGVEAAHRDYRDVLVGAEYPRQMRFPAGAAQTSDTAAYRAAVQADCQEYLAWLNEESGTG